jgi:phosphomannomutase
MMLPIYEEQLARKPGTPVRIDARTNLVVDEAVRYWKGKSICQAIGHSKVKKGMDLDLVEEARQAGYDNVDTYVQDQPARAETFQGEFSLHLFRFKPERDDEGRWVGTPVDDAIDFACYFIHMLQKRGKSLSRPCLQLPEYLDMLRAQGLIGDSYTHAENNIEIRTNYDALLKKNLGFAAFEIFRLIAAPDEEVTWIDDGVSAIAPGRKLMLRFSNTSPKVTMKCDARPELWIEAASRLLGVFLGITDYLIAARGLDKKFRTLSKNENEFLYEIFRTRAGRDVAAIEPFPVAEYLSVPSLKEALHKDF